MAYPLLLHGKHSADDVRYEALGAWIVPWVFTSLADEYASLKTACGLIDYSTQALIEVRGKDRAVFLHNLLTQHIKQLTPGTGALTALLTANGKLVAVFLALCDAESLWLMCDADQAALITETLNRYLFSEQVTIVNHEREQAVLALEGPKTLEVLQRLAGSAAALAKTCGHHRILLDDIPLWLIKHSIIGGAGALCVIAGEYTEGLWNRLQACGAGAGLNRVGWEALNTARIESGIPWFGIDMAGDNLLPETGLETAVVSGTKGCYLGQEVIARLGTYGSLNKKLMGLRIEGDTVPEAADAIISGDAEAGKVTSACWSLGLKQPIALGYLKRGYYETGKSVIVRSRQSNLKAVVAKLPFI